MKGKCRTHPATCPFSPVCLVPHLLGLCELGSRDSSSGCPDLWVQEDSEARRASMGVDWLMSATAAGGGALAVLAEAGSALQHQGDLLVAIAFPRWC